MLVIECREPAARSDELLPLEAVIGVGTGIATLTRDGGAVYEHCGEEGGRLMSVAEAEELARRSPQHDWCIHLVALLDDRHYRRVGAGAWRLYRRGYGLS